MKYSTRDLVTMAVFGSLWGISEISLGTIIKSLNIPLSGMVLSTIGLTIALVGRVFVSQKGSTLFIGAIAMLLKLFSLGGVVMGPMIGIISEAIVAEGTLSLTGKPKRGSMILAGSLGVLWVLVQPFITNPIMFGRTVLDVWLNLLVAGSRVLGINGSSAVWVISGLVVIHLGIGGGAGWLGWRLGNLLQTRLGRGSISIN